MAPDAYKTLVSAKEGEGAWWSCQFWVQGHFVECLDYLDKLCVRHFQNSNIWVGRMMYKSGQFVSDRGIVINDVDQYLKQHSSQHEKLSWSNK